MKCKKSIMGFAALLILIFHFYIPFSKSGIEISLWRATFIGVDLFFFVSGYSLGGRKKLKFLPFLENRVRLVYIPFALMSIMATLYKRWNIGRLVKILIGIEFLEKGGGAFLWFVPALMIFYLFAPLFIKLKDKCGIYALFYLLGIWCLVAILFQYILGLNTVFIMINRMPVFCLGLFYDEYRKRDLTKIKFFATIFGFVLGFYLVYKWGTTVRLSKPFADMYYVSAIPLVISIVGIFDYVSERIKIKNDILALLGKITLELYGVQMIFGYDIETRLLKYTNNGVLSFVITIIVLVIMAVVVNYIFMKINLLFEYIRENMRYEKNAS